MSEHTILMLEKAGIAAVIFIVGFIIIEVFLHIMKKALKKSRIDDALHPFIIRSTKIILWIMLIITILPRLGVSTASLVTVLGAAGAAIALALKDSLGNIAGGIIILINKPFSRGDLIEVNGFSGQVESIDILTTRLHTLDNKVVSIPNGTITTSVLINNSEEDSRRVDCVFGIGYETDIDKAKAILQEVASANSMIFGEPAPIIGVSSQGDNALMLDLKVWCLTEHYYDVKYFLEETVKKTFDKEGIRIPYQQLDVHIVK